MPTPTPVKRRARLRQLLLLREPALWPHWPVLPVVRRAAGSVQCGLMFDARRAAGRYGYSATVFLTRVSTLPCAVAAFLELPREVYDTAEEVYAAGWRVD